MAYPSIIRRTTLQGRDQGIKLQSRDIEFLQHSARWWVTTPDAFVRAYQPESVWGPAYIDGDQELRDRLAYSVRRRMSRLCSTDTGVRPLLGQGYAGPTEGVFWITMEGARLIGAPWGAYPQAHLNAVSHAVFATDVGLDLERQGYTVYSERETSLGRNVLGEDVIGGRLETASRTSRSPNPHHGQRPDLSLVGPDGRLIAIEVERTQKAEHKYKKKLLTYAGLDDDRISSVWYVTPSTSIARRVRKVHSDLLADGLRDDITVRLIKAEQMCFGYHRALWSPALREDLDRVGATGSLNA